jgi:hypothetical protein
VNTLPATENLLSEPVDKHITSNKDKRPLTFISKKEALEPIPPLRGEETKPCLWG